MAHVKRLSILTAVVSAEQRPGYKWKPERPVLPVSLFKGSMVALHYSYFIEAPVEGVRNGVWKALLPLSWL